MIENVQKSVARRLTGKNPFVPLLLTSPLMKHIIQRKEKENIMPKRSGFSASKRRITKQSKSHIRGSH